MAEIYLDNNATTRLHPEVAEAMARCFRDGLTNPASQHLLGRRARRVLEDARQRICQLLGADISGRHGDVLIFTSGGTEANNLALFARLNGATHRRAVISSIEHPSVTAAAAELTRRGWQIHHLPAARDGTTQLEPLAGYLEQGVDLVSLMLANNETGVLQPVAELARLCQAGVLVHTDAVQAIGKVPVNFCQLGVSSLSVGAHKFHGPVGIGALLVRRDALPEPMLHGGFQQAGLRPGTEPVALAVGMCRALELWHEDQQRATRMTTLRDRLQQGILAIEPAAVIVGAEAQRLPQTLCVAFPGRERQAVQMALDMHGIACSTGSACASGSSEPSPVLRAMQLEETTIASAIRLSLAADTTVEEVEQALTAIAAALGKVPDRRSVEGRGVGNEQWTARPL